jgi:tetratricopeptide (TPR) repeat protein
MGLFGKRRQERVEAELRAAHDEFRKVAGGDQLHLAEPGLRAARDRARAELGDRDMLTLRLWQLHASALGNLGRGEEAEREFLKVAEAAGSEAPARWTGLIALTNRAAQLCFLERFADAEAQAQEVVAAASRLPTPQDLYTRLSGLNTQAMAAVGLGRATDAEALAREALAEARSRSGDTGSFQRTLGVNLASALNAQGRHAEALEVVAEAEKVRDATHTRSDASAIAKARATALLALDRHKEAAETARTGLTAALSAYGEAHARVRDLRALLARAEAAMTGQ